ncbi:zinc finger protein 653 isoform X1 [Globicephala melas]|uniref:zinc finger protein 653 isoform X1 n=1 Tax=Globicephala melas TaxID=9731 RepID=UPI00122EFC38|nr:zinc finger protein 653 isoform X1 [Globicephala melas]
MAERAPEPEAEAEAEAEAGAGGEVAAEEGAAGRKARGRPRLTESDRARRRLESRKKYDVRRVYLGEAHGPWVDLRRRSGWSDAKLAAYLISLERGQRSSRHGKPWEQVPKKPKRKKRRRRNVNCLKNVVIWYEDHKHRCPYEPHLAELDPTFGLYTTAVWQCEAGHRYFQDLHSPLKPLSDSDPESDKVGNGLVAGSSDSSSSSSGSEEPPEGQQAKATVAMAAVTPTSPAGSSGLITQEGMHIPFDVHHVESLAEQGTPLCPNPASSGPEALETVVCVPVPVQVGPGPSTLFENMPQEALGEVVASCPMPGMVPGSQVIIIAGPGYDALTAEGIHLNVAAGNGAPGGGLGDEVPCAMMEGVAAYTQTEPEGSQPSTVEPDAMTGIETKKEKEDLHVLKKEKEEPVAPELAELAATVPESAEPEAEADGEELDGSDMSAIIYEIPKEPEKRRRSKRSRVMDADGLLEMFHCPYEGCSQVYVALSSFQNHVNLVHRKGKTKVCPHPGCGKKFYLSNHLRRHMIIHSGVREFTCETCGKSFKRKNHLEVHRRTHTGETPLQCEICGYQCRQRASLNWHMKKHTAEVQYNFTCERCGKRFEKLDSVKFHTLKSHPDHKPA